MDSDNLITIQPEDEAAQEDQYTGEYSTIPLFDLSPGYLIAAATDNLTGGDMSSLDATPLISGKTGALAGAIAGARIGSMISPFLGTLAGAAIGAFSVTI